MNNHIGKLGLINNGNTCYLNACLQLLSHSGFFVHNFFKEVKQNKQEKLNNVEKEILKLLLEKWISKNKVYNPIEIQKSIAKHNDFFSLRNRRQNDSSEAMIFILDLIENKKLKKVFESKIKSVKQCMNCKNITIMNEIFTILSLDMTNDINDSLELFEQTEKMDGQVHCDKCGSKQDYERTYQLDDMADNLIIHMKRFQPIKNQKYKKDNRQVNIVDVITINDISYELRGINIHTGRMGGGHCFFTGKSLTNGWIMFNDSACYDKPLNIKEYEKTGYLFLYEKIKK